MVFGDFKDFSRMTAPHKLSSGKAFNMAKNPRFNSYQRELASMIYQLFDLKSGCAIKSKVIPNHKLPNKQHKQIIKKT